MRSPIGRSAGVASQTKTPETAAERDPEHVVREVKRLGIPYPVLTDQKGENWNRWRQRSRRRMPWPGRPFLRATAPPATAWRPTWWDRP